MIVTVAVVEAPGLIPTGGSKLVVKLSSPSRASVSSLNTNSTHAFVSPGANDAVRFSSKKSSVPALKLNNIVSNIEIL